MLVSISQRNIINKRGKQKKRLKGVEKWGRGQKVQTSHSRCWPIFHFRPSKTSALSSSKIRDIINCKCFDFIVLSATHERPPSYPLQIFYFIFWDNLKISNVSFSFWSIPALQILNLLRNLTLNLVLYWEFVMGLYDVSLYAIEFVGFYVQSPFAYQYWFFCFFQ